MRRQQVTEINAELRGPVREQMLRDIMCTAFEGGCNYWAEARRVQRGGDGGTEYLSFDLRSAEDRVDKRLGAWVRIDPDAIERGMQRIADSRKPDAPRCKVAPGHPSASHAACGVCDTIFAAVLTAIADPEGADLDAGDADCIVQAAMWGEIIYG
jgi:hypothetical protein